MDKTLNLIAALTLPLAFAGTAEARQAPAAIRLFPSGSFSPIGTPSVGSAPGGQWVIDAALAKQVIARVAATKTDELIDYEHQSLFCRDNGKPAPAAGWFKSVEWREAPADDGGGLWATDVSWTANARAALEAGEYRYLSPVFSHDPQGRVQSLVSVALTNKPALDTLDPLVSRAALSLINGAPQLEDTSVTLTPEQIAALTAQRDAAQTQVAALTQERDAANTKVAALTQERDQLKAAAEQAKAAADKKAHADLLQAALTDGRLIPADKPWAEGQSLAALSQFLEGRKPLVDLSRQSKRDADGGQQGLTQDELAMCARMDVKPEDFLKAKA